MKNIIEVFGRADDPDLYFSHHVANRIARLNFDVEVKFEQMLEVDYLNRIDKLKSEFGGSYYGHKYGHCVRLNGEYLGYLMDLTKAATDQFGVHDAEVANMNTFQNLAKSETERICKSISNTVVFLDFQPYGRISIELFNDLCPNATSNFVKFCIGGTAGAGVAFNYTNTPVHRVVQNGWIQCGDVVDGSGANSISSTGGPIEDECFSVDFGNARGGILGYVSSGPHSNGSQFFITLGSCSWMNNSKVGFGRVIQGYDVLNQINVAPCRNQRPIPDIMIEKCGKY
jgi:cyclophilin family peptidyl-prolyl cis-trans isomerase